MFERENRYWVPKVSDIRKLDTSDKYILMDIMDKVDRLRYSLDKPVLKCVVVESDWPEYDVVWKMIEERCK